MAITNGGPPSLERGRRRGEKDGICRRQSWVSLLHERRRGFVYAASPSAAQASLVNVGPPYQETTNEAPAACGPTSGVTRQPTVDFGASEPMPAL
jgi:hypothetical protein